MQSTPSCCGDCAHAAEYHLLTAVRAAHHPVHATRAVETIASNISQTENLELKCAMCFLLTGLAAFSDTTHEIMISNGLVPQLVGLCRAKTSVSVCRGSSTASLPGTLSTRRPCRYKL